MIKIKIMKLTMVFGYEQLAIPTICGIYNSMQLMITSNTYFSRFLILKNELIFNRPFRTTSIW